MRCWSSATSSRTSSPGTAGRSPPAPTPPPSSGGCPAARAPTSRAGPPTGGVRTYGCSAGSVSTPRPGTSGSWPPTVCARSWSSTRGADGDGGLPGRHGRFGRAHLPHGQRCVVAADRASGLTHCSTASRGCISRAICSSPSRAARWCRLPWRRHARVGCRSAWIRRRRGSSPNWASTASSGWWRASTSCCPVGTRRVCSPVCPIRRTRRQVQSARTAGGRQTGRGGGSGRPDRGGPHAGRRGDGAPRDTTGAGDAFTGAFLAALLAGSARGRPPPRGAGPGHGRSNGWAGGRRSRAAGTATGPARFAASYPLRPHAEISGAVARSMPPAATFARWRSMSSSVAWPPATRRSRT